MNGPTFSQNPRKQGKNHDQKPLLTNSQSIVFAREFRDFRSHQTTVRKGFLILINVSFVCVGQV